MSITNNNTNTNNTSSEFHPRNVYIASLPKRFTDTDILRLFEPFGRVISAKVMFDKEGVSKGFGFVLFSSSESATAAIQGLVGASIDGTRVQVRRAKATSNTSVNSAAHTTVSNANAPPVSPPPPLSSVPVMPMPGAPMVAGAIPTPATPPPMYQGPIQGYGQPILMPVAPPAVYPGQPIPHGVQPPMLPAFPVLGYPPPNAFPVLPPSPFTPHQPVPQQSFQQKQTTPTTAPAGGGLQTSPNGGTPNSSAPSTPAGMRIVSPPAERTGTQNILLVPQTTFSAPNPQAQ